MRAHEPARRTASRWWLRALLAALMLATLQIGALRTALGMECPRTPTTVIAASAAVAVLTAVTTVPGDHVPHPALASACPASAWLPETSVAAPPALPPDPADLESEARPRPDPSLRPPFHPPRSV